MVSATDARLLKQTKFPPEFNQKVDVKKINIEVMKKWIAGKISEILGNEDDVVIELCFNLLEGTRFPDIKHLQIQLTGFLDKDTAPFCKDLWNLCLSAQSNPQGVPKELLEAKKLELIQEKLAAEKAAEEARRQREEERRRELELEALRRREREDRGGWRGRNDRRRFRDSRSPPPRRRSLDRYREGPPPRRRGDTYVPSGGRRPGRRDEEPPRRYSRGVSRSSERSSSRSSSPPRRERRERTRSVSSSRSPERPSAKRRRRDDDRSRSRRRQSPIRDRRRRSLSSSTPPSVSRSPSPRSRRPIRRRSPSRSRSRSLSSARSVSRSSSPERRRRGGRSRRSPSKDTRHNSRREPRADVTKEHKSPENRRPNRSRERHGLDRRELPTRARSRSQSPRPLNHRRRRSPSRSRSRSRSSSSTRQAGRKRHHSIVRYAPAGKRQPRKSTSISPHAQKRQKVTDEEETKKHDSVQPSIGGDPGDEKRGETTSHHDEIRRVSRLTATELRERILKEKVKAMRRSLSGNQASNSQYV